MEPDDEKSELPMLDISDKLTSDFLAPTYTTLSKLLIHDNQVGNSLWEALEQSNTIRELSIDKSMLDRVRLRNNTKGATLT